MVLLRDRRGVIELVKDELPVILELALAKMNHKVELWGTHMGKSLSAN